MQFLSQTACVFFYLSMGTLLKAAPLEPRGAPPPPANTPPSVPIGHGSEDFARVDGCRFNIDGKTQYFAGNDRDENTREGWTLY